MREFDIKLVRQLVYNNRYDELYSYAMESCDGENAKIIYTLGICYATGKNVDKDNKRAFECFAKANELGYSEGERAEFECIRLEAEENNPLAQFMLGNIYRKGDMTEFNPEKAFECYNAAAENGIGEAMFNLGSCYYYGIGVEENKNIAIQKYKDAVEMGCALAAYNLGVCYMLGEGTVENPEKAFLCFKEAADDEITEAVANLGVCYYKGYGTKQDFKKAYRCFLKAEHAGNVNAAINLAVCCFNGEGTARNTKKAMEVMENIAEFDNPSALWNMFVCYYRGKGVKKDRQRAMNYAKRAAGLGLECAKKFVEDYEKKNSGTFLEKLSVFFVHPRLIQLECENRMLKDENAFLKEQVIDKIAGLEDFVKNELTAFIKNEREILLKKIEKSEENLENYINEFRKAVSKDLIARAKSTDMLFYEHEEKLKNLFGENWTDARKMPEGAKNALVSASVMWDKCSEVPDDRLDYSGVCILATAALEEIVKNIFFFDFMDYFKRTNNIHYASLLNCPDTLLFFHEEEFVAATKEYEKLEHGIKHVYNSSFLRDENVMLGSIQYLFLKKKHFAVRKNEKSEFAKYKAELTKNAFEAFLRTIVKPQHAAHPIDAFDGFVNHCDMITKEFRNKSAHTSSIGKEKAAQCFAAVVGQSDRLAAYRNIIEVEAVLLKMFEILK